MITFAFGKSIPTSITVVEIKISEEDMKLRGYCDLLGFKQSGIQSFRLADPVLNEDLFLLAEKEVKKIERNNIDLDKFKSLLKLYDRADILNDIV